MYIRNYSRYINKYTKTFASCQGRNSEVNFKYMNEDPIVGVTP